GRTKLFLSLAVLETQPSLFANYSQDLPRFYKNPIISVLSPNSSLLIILLFSTSISKKISFIFCFLFNGSKDLPKIERYFPSCQFGLNQKLKFYGKISKLFFFFK